MQQARSWDRINEGIALEAAEEAKVEGVDGDQEVVGGYEHAPIDDEFDELVDGEVGTAGDQEHEGSERPSAVYREQAGRSATAAPPDPREVEGYEAQGAADPLPDEELFAPRHAPHPETVFPPDNRVQVHATQAYPWRTICQLIITPAIGGPQSRCTGVMIGPRTVLTNGHCVYMHDRGGWAQKIQVIPGKNGSHEPFGSAESSFYHSVTGWVNNRSSNYDYAVVVLPPNQKLGLQTGWMGLASLSAATLMGMRVNTSGYPGDKPFGTQWWNANDVLAVTARRLYYRLDTFPGQSGSPVWRFRNNQRHIVAVHNTGGPVFNGSVRLVRAVFDNLVKWKDQYT
jgi:V8-like Glu-specific endopeptidase